MKKELKLIYNLLPFKKQLFQILRRFNIPKSIYQHLHFKDTIKIEFDQYQFLMEHYGYQIENDVFWAGLAKGWEKISLQLWIDLCKDSNVIIDVGANTGIYSLVAKAIKPTAGVYGFEPVKRVFEKYRKNCELNKFDIICNDYALSNFDGEAIIYDDASEHIYSVTVNKNLNPHDITKETKIKTKKLSTFIHEYNLHSIDLIKIDVETHEPEVLEGMGEFLDKFQPTLLIEILTNEIGQRVQSILSGINYLYFNVDEQNPPKRVETLTKSDHFNYLICKKDVALKLRLI